MRFFINNVWYDAPNYAEANKLAKASQPTIGPTTTPAPVVQVTITPVLTPDATFLNRSMVRFGIGETMALSFTTTPPGRTAASFGGLDWFVRSGPATVTQTPGNLGTGRLTCGTIGGPVVLELRTVGMPVAVKATKRFEVLRPNDVVFARSAGTGTFHRRGRPSAGFEAITYLRPADVSFGKLEFREGGGAYQGTGIFAIREVTRTQLDTSSRVIHPIRADWNAVDGGDNSVNGSLVSGEDTVKTEINQVGVGTFTWSIPQIVRVVGTQNDFPVVSLDHAVTVDALGVLTISKGGVIVTHNLNDADSDI